MSTLRPAAAPAVSATVALALSFALMGVWIRMMGDRFATFQQVYLRVLLAGLIAALAFRKHLPLRHLRSMPRREWGIYGLRSLVAYAGGVGLSTVAVLNADLSTVAFISSLPVVGLLAWLMFHEKMQAATVPILGSSDLRV